MRGFGISGWGPSWFGTIEVGSYFIVCCFGPKLWIIPIFASKDCSYAELKTYLHADAN
jgi:hypothetical protein